jgi:ribonuclease VapC
VALMVIDSSALIACLLDEPERARFIAAIEADPVKVISVVGFVETSLVILGRKGEPGFADLKRFIADAQIQRVSIDANQADLAVEAFRRFGKGRHPAGLNIGDCFACSLAAATDEKLLYKGADFARTDIAAAVTANDPPQENARRNAAQTWRWAAIASSTTGTMPRKPWIMPGYSRYSTGIPAARSAAA